MKKTLLSGIGLLALAGFTMPASAADIARPITKAPVAAPVPPFTWSGCYIGVNAGWIGSRNRVLLSPSGSYLNAPGPLAPPNGAFTGLLAGDFFLAQSAFRFDDDGFTGGGQVGCNWQVSWFVFGIEGDFNGTSIDNTRTVIFPAQPSVNPAFTIGTQTDTITKKLDWFATVRGRLGFAWDRFLIYGTGGVAFADFESSTTVAFAAVPGTLPVFDNAVHSATVSDTRTRAVYGGGIEWAFTTNWTVKVEYLHMDLGTITYVSPLVQPALLSGGGYSWTTSHRERNDVVRVGVNYKFDWIPFGRY